MRKNLALVVAVLALLQAWSVIGQDLTLDSPLDAPAALTAFLNESGNETGNITVNNTVNDTANMTAVDANMTTTASQQDFLDQPVNDTAVDTNLTTTASQQDFLDQPVNESRISGLEPSWTSSIYAFLMDEPMEEPEPLYTRGQMMSEETSTASSDNPYKRGEMMGDFD